MIEKLISPRLLYAFALVLILLNQQIVSYTEYWPFVLGLILIVLLFAFPGGLAGAAGIAVRRRWRA